MSLRRMTGNFLLFSLMLSVAASAQSRRMRPPGDRPTSGPSAPDAPPPAPATTEPKLSVTDHQILLDGAPFKYRATAGTLPMKDDTGKVKANIFFVAYDTKDSDPTTRPVSFVFNGGPGAASVFLHMGAAGPKTLDLDAESIPKGPPFKLIDNQNTWLRGSDLVFIDPVSTGFSRPAPGEDARQFHGVQQDVASVGEFIRVYMTKYQRWGSPVYLAGESYGTTRASALANYLSQRLGISVSGVTLISSVLDFRTLDGGNGNDEPYEMFLPSYSAVAWYHKRLSPEYQADMDKTVAASKKFALEVYAPALQKGASLTQAERAQLVKQLSAFTGLTEDLISRDNLRIDPEQFMKQLLGDGHHIIGRYDGRITGYDSDAANNEPGWDPSSSRYDSAYTSTFNQYIRGELKYESDLTYETLANVYPWPTQDLYVTDDLQSAMLQNFHMRVQFMSGYYDLATPFFSADYTIDRMDVNPEVRANISHLYFPSGHMIYHNRDSAKKLAAAMDKFVSVGLPAATQP